MADRWYYARRDAGCGVRGADCGLRIAQRDIASELHGPTSQIVRTRTIGRDEQFATRPEVTVVLSFRDLEVWQAGMDLVVSVYKQSAGFPADERFGLTAQMRRAATSIPSNVAEGHARRSDGAYLNHVKIALGSQAELGTQVEIAKRLGYVDEGRADALLKHIDRTRQMLHGLRRSLERRRYVAVCGFIAWWFSAVSLVG